MKKFVLISLLAFISFFIGVARADYYESRIQNCNPAMMRAALDNASRKHGAVITVIKCRETRVQTAPIYTEMYNYYEPIQTVDYMEPVYTPLYIPRHCGSCGC